METVRSDALGFMVQLSYGVGHVLNDVCASLWFTYLLVYLHLVLDFDAKQAGTLMLVGQVADALSTPFVGYHSDVTDNTFSRKYGKRKLWHLFGTFCVLCSFLFIFNHCIECENTHKWAQMYYYSSFIIIFQIGWAAVQVSHLSLIPELSDDYHVRTHLTAIRYAFTVFSNIFVYIITWLVIRVDEECDKKQIGPEDEGKFRIIVYICTSVGSLASLIFHFFVKEKQKYPNQEHIHQDSSSHIGFLKSLNFYKVGVVYMCTRLFVNIAQTMVPLYIHRTLKLPQMALALVPLAMYMGSLLAATLQRLLPRSAGRKINYFVGATIGFAGSCGVYFGAGPLYDKYLIYCVALAIGFGGAFMLVTSLALTADLVGAKTNTSAFVYGLMSFTDKLSCGIAIFVIQSYAVADSYSDYYKLVISWVCCISAVVGLLFTLILPNMNLVTSQDVITSTNEETSPLLRPDHRNSD